MGQHSTWTFQFYFILYTSRERRERSPPLPKIVLPS